VFTAVVSTALATGPPRDCRWTASMSCTWSERGAVRQPRKDTAAYTRMCALHDLSVRSQNSVNGDDVIAGR
jgi:hypothetical protein